MMRRQMSVSSHMHLGAGGEFHSAGRHEAEDGHPYEDFNGCVQVFTVGAGGSDTCNSAAVTAVGGDHVVKIAKSTVCKHSAAMQGYTVADTNAPNAEACKAGDISQCAFDVTFQGSYCTASTCDNTTHPSLPKGCIVVDKALDDGTQYTKVHFNPSEAASTNFETGASTICLTLVYRAGLKGAGGTAPTCPQGYEAMSNHTECLWSKECAYSELFCSETKFAESDYETDDAPAGCYNAHDGCFGFNAKASPAGNQDNTRLFCRLTGYPAFTSRWETSGRLGAEANPFPTA